MSHDAKGLLVLVLSFIGLFFDMIIKQIPHGIFPIVIGVGVIWWSLRLRKVGVRIWATIAITLSVISIINAVVYLVR